MTMVREAAPQRGSTVPARGQTHGNRRLRTAGEGRGLLRVACAAGALVVSAVVLAGQGSGGQLAALEGPWTPEGEVVMKPGLTFNQMNELHGQLEQARWASRFGTNVPKQVSPVAHVRAEKASHANAGVAVVHATGSRSFGGEKQQAY